MDSAEAPVPEPTVVGEREPADQDGQEEVHWVEDNEDQPLPHFVASSIFEAAAAIIMLKQKIGDARMDVLSKGMEFCRLVYGSPSSALMVVLLHVRQDCGWCHKFNYD